MMGEAQVGDIGDQLIGEFVVGQEAAVLAAPPGAEMDLVDRHRLAARFALAALGHVVGVGPGEIGGVGDDRSGRGPQLRLEAERVGLQRLQDAVGARRSRICRRRPRPDAE